MTVLAIDEIAVARRVLRLAGHERRAAVVVALLGLVSAVFEGIGLSFLIPLAGLAMGDGMDTSIPVIGPMLDWLMARYELTSVHIVFFVVGFFVLGIVVSYLNIIVSNVLAMRFAHALRVSVFESALSRKMSEIESMPSGKLVNDLATETWQACDALFIVIRVAIQLITCAVFLAFLLMLSPFYTAILIAMTALMAITVHLATAAVRRLGADAVAANERFMAYIWDALGGLRVIRGFGREPHERRRFVENSGRISAIFTRLGILSGLVGPITQIMTVGMIASILAIAFWRGDPLSGLVGFLAIAYRVQPRISIILGARTKLRSLDASIAAIEKGLEGFPDATEPRGRPFSGLSRGVVLEALFARYPNAERPALRDVSCSFPYGKVTAVAGYSGAGKSTLVALLLRFIEPERGRILIDGVPLSEILPESWHHRIAFVEQNAFLFNASVRENIGYGDLDADFEAIREAARVAQADQFIAAMPEGYDTMIGDNGVRLSQGQRQRIALARSLLRKPDVLILDEATNALDRPTERALRDAIAGARDVRAVIVIAHRRETIDSADHVIVIDKGQVVEAGTPQELLRARGVFSQLYLDDVSTAQG